MKQPYTLLYAKFPHLFVHAPELFCCTPKDGSYRRKLDFQYEVSNDEGTSTYDFHGFEQLRSIDLRVLQGIVATACASLSRKDKKDGLFRDGHARKHGLALAGDAAAQTVIAARFKLSAFARELGYARPNSPTLKRLRESIERLSTVTVVVERPDFKGSYRLLSGYWQEADSGDVVVALNPELSAAVLRKKKFLRVDMAEVRALRSDVAHLLHHRLLWNNAGKRGQVGLDTLVEYGYGDTPATYSARANRRKSARKALDELMALGWDVHRVGKLYHILRPARGKAAFK